MKIGIRGHDLPERGADGLIQGLKKNNISALQLVAYKSFPEIEYKPGAVTAEKAVEIGGLLSENNIEVGLIGAYFNPVHSQKVKVENSISVFCDYLACGKALGCNIVGSETGSFNDDKWTYHPQNRTDAARETVAETFSGLCEKAERLGMNVGIEGAAGHVLYDVDTLYKAYKEIGAPNLKIIFDIYNFLDETNSVDYLDILDRGIELFENNIHCFHIKDCTVAKGEKPVQKPVGRGDFDFSVILSKIRRHNENALLILEGTTGDDIHYGVNFLATKIKEKGGE